MSRSEFRILNQDEFSLWDSLVESTADALYFQRSDWLYATSHLLDLEPKIYGYFYNDTLIGGCTLHLERKWSGIVKASSVSNCSQYGGLTLDMSVVKSSQRRETLFHTFCSDVCRELIRDGYDHVIVQNPPGLQDVRIFDWNGWKCRVLYTYRLSPAEQAYSRAARKQIALAIRYGITIERSKDVRLFSELLKEMYASKGLPPFCDIDRLQPVFEGLLRSGDGELWLARDPDGTVNAADLIIIDSKRAYRWCAASRPDRRLNGSVFLQLATIIESLHSRSIPSFIMMTANVPELSEFTAKFNPEPVPYFHCEFMTHRYRYYHQIRSLLSILNNAR
ncbi:MAG TPA: GNAT family N-acetyltransferase [Methanoregulaceae archaeon]|nr:GNAT family N-acetyltransferase [Methanoregulaceae archaeon]